VREQISKLREGCDEIIFIQIGSNVGIMETDPLCALIINERWRGVLIEPVPRIFAQLKKNYAHCPHVYCENVAVSDMRGWREFYVIDENAAFFETRKDWTNEAGGLWGDLVGSLDRNHVLACKNEITEREIKTIQVECVTFQDILDKHHLSRVDVVHLDVEGHEAIILRSIDFEQIRPKLIIFEHVHMSFETYFSVVELLQGHGYEVVYTSVLDTMISLLH